MYVCMRVLCYIYNVTYLNTIYSTIYRVISIVIERLPCTLEQELTATFSHAPASVKLHSQYGILTQCSIIWGHVVTIIATVIIIHNDNNTIIITHS